MFSYTTVQKKKKGKKRKDVGRQDLAVQLDDVRRRIVASDWFRQSVELIDDGSIHPDEALCLGLGSPSSSTVARTQLAFLVELCAHMDIHPESVSLYDPVFTEEDKQLFQDHLKFNVLPDSSNCNGAHELERFTLCFMPHCDMQLYEALLGCNDWSRLHDRLLLLGNDLQSYIESKPDSELRRSAPCIRHLAPLLVSRPLPTNPDWPTAFNNTAAQRFPAGIPARVNIIPSCDDAQMANTVLLPHGRRLSDDPE